MRRSSVVAVMCAVLFISVGISSSSSSLFGATFGTTIDRVIALMGEFNDLVRDRLLGRISDRECAVEAAWMADQAEILFYLAAVRCSTERDANLLLAVAAPAAISMRLFAQGVAERDTDKTAAVSEVMGYGKWLTGELQKLLGR